MVQCRLVVGSIGGLLGTLGSNSTGGFRTLIFIKMIFQSRFMFQPSRNRIIIIIIIIIINSVCSKNRL
jgi:hypothetical protein